LRRVATILLYGDTIRYPALRHEVPLETAIRAVERCGVRFEDLLLITGDGCETLTRYAYEL
jgi:hypothetical protein